MRRVALVALLSFTGCINGSKKPGFVVGGAAAVAGVVLLASTQQQDCTDMSFGEAVSCGSEELGAMFLGTTALLAGMGIITLTAVIPTPGEEEPEPKIAEARLQPLMAPEAADDMLRQLTVQARDAASDGRCESVEVIAQRVDQLDRAYRHNGFVADPLIAECLR